MLTKIFKVVIRIIIWFFILSIISVIAFRWLPVPISPLMIIRCVEQKNDGKNMTLKHDWVSLDEISPKLQLAVVCSEDQNYLKHFGFDWGAIEKAMKNNDSNKKIRGGSTISQQTAKNVFLWPGRSYIRKGFEAYFTLLIEVFWSKERIMEVYLNTIEMGNGIYGAEAAAQYWFKKSAIKLNKDESAAIAAILPNPLKYIANPPSPYISKRKAWIKQQMSFWGNQLDYDKYNDEDEVKEKTVVKKTSAKKEK
ncbi:MAG: monofunctional biosynthetic peptidoglycan transglycosylase [Bacteroidota bacterium]|nr:monofunctional biosynthetic peptidoglycan transglycosylase [Bacteroidota bacterium]MDP3145293.1 monofunctional biosynthetic peptidoglycan transglycosylase [Bacteroidota bacterium]